MGSRIRDEPEHIFEVFAEVGRPTEPNGVAFVLQNYPEEIQDKKILELEIPKFAFPAEVDSGAVDHFSFVLTDEEGKFKYGFCRHAAGSQTCLCIVSFLPWFEIFYRLLNLLAEILNRTESNHVRPVLEALFKHHVPSSGEKVELLSHDPKQLFTFTCPNSAELPRIPQNRNLTEYYNAVNVHTMMSIYACMLQERRILIISRKLSRLTACIHGSASLLYPMFWQHIYIPKLRPSELGDVVVVDADNSTVSSEYNDLEVLPSEVVSLLKKRLKAQNAEKIGSSILGDGVAKAFLRANVALIGGYREALRFPPGEQIKFDEDAFIHSRPSSMQPFLQTVLHTQMFEQFINDRLDKLIAGEGFSDIFDEEVNLEHDKWATQSRYKEWYGNMKKQGKKVRKEGKEKWVEFSSKVSELFSLSSLFHI
ncbi:hypothetical protein LSH36_59g07026 [Paralvinella palmiformis]|uniref:UDENN domain-containing protein n=1 Tax=Paralvinella palmiformis TaxID=53620 RepID=A0AAD9K697_9ANNE|nr:hypothetical protein LSH36_59g07026 [Paralvinella palmiformis]